MKSIFQYRDYREFLRDFYSEQKLQKSKYSYRSFASAAGLQSPNYLKLIMDAQRNLTVPNIHAVARAMGLSFGETAYFETLVLWNQSTSLAEEEFYGRRLEDMAEKAPRKMAKLTIDKLLGAWYYPAVWGLLDSKLAPIDSDAIAASVGITSEQAEEAVALLQDHGLVRVESGRYVLRQDCILFNDKRLINRAQKSFLRDQILRSLTEFDRNYTKGSKFFAQTLTIRKDRFQQYVDRVLSFLTTMAKASEEDQPESAVQLNIQLFRLGSTDMG